VPDDFVQRGKGLLVRREFAEVIEVCRQGLAANPSRLDGRLLLGTALLGLKRYDEAVEEMRVAEKQDPANVLVHLLRGEALLRRGDTLSAIEALAEAHALDPRNKVAAKLYNEALERAHGKQAEEVPPEAIAAEISGNIAVEPLRFAGDEGARGAAGGDGSRGVGTPGSETLIADAFGPGPAIRTGATGRSVGGGTAGRGVGSETTVRAFGSEATARAGSEAPGRAVAAGTAARAAEPRHRRRVWPWILVAGMLIVLTGGGAATALYLRANRQAEELRSRRSEAERAAAAQTYRGYRHAAELYEAMAQSGDTGAAGSAARLRAASTFEFGEPAAAASSPPSAAPVDREGHVAGIYRLLTGNETATALRAAQLVAASFPEDGEAAYLVGRAGVRSHDSGAVPALKRSVALAPTPLAWTALGEADAAEGRVADALRAFEAALALVPGHPSALIARARVLAASARLPDGDEPERTLAKLTESGADVDPLLSPRQAHLAALALAEVKLARGDAAGAQRVLAGVAPTESEDPRFGEVLVTALLAAGDTAGAEREAEAWRKGLPASGAPHVWLARVALARDKPETVRSELEQAGEARDSASALVVLGEVELSAGRLDAAIAALDKALLVRAGDRDAQVLRARADLARGDAPAAEARLAPLYDAGRDPVIGVALGESLLARDAGPQARAVLEESVTKLEASGLRPRLQASASLALARLARAEGRWAEAQRDIARTLAVDGRDIEARLLEAELRADVGDALGARTALDTLAVTAHTDGRVLLAAARAHALTGDVAGAHPLLDAATKLVGTPRGMLAEVTGRILILDGKPDEAAAALVSGSGPETPAAGLVLVDALIAGGKLDDAESAAGEVAKRAAGKPEESLAAGRVQLARKDAPAAVASFTTALQRLESGAAAAQALADARTWLGRAQETAGRTVDALVSYREAVRLSPTSGAAAVLLGRALVGKGDFAAAQNLLGQALKLNPSLAEAYFWIAQAARGLKKPREARQALQTYLELAPHGAEAAAAQKLLGEP